MGKDAVHLGVPVTVATLELCILIPAGVTAGQLRVVPTVHYLRPGGELAGRVTCGGHFLCAPVQYIAVGVAQLVEESSEEFPHVGVVWHPQAELHTVHYTGSDKNRKLFQPLLTAHKLCTMHFNS